MSVPWRARARGGRLAWCSSVWSHWPSRLRKARGATGSASPSSTVTTPRPPSAPSPMPRSSRRSRWAAGSGRLSSTASAARHAARGGLFGLPRCRPVRVRPRPLDRLPGSTAVGAGSALGFPVGLSAGSDDPTRVAARVGVITSIGYCGFVGGPPLIGFLAERTALAPALLVVAALMAASVALAAPSVPPRRPHTNKRPTPHPPRPHTQHTEENAMPTGSPVIKVSDAELDDLRTRLRATRWPEPWPIDGGRPAPTPPSSVASHLLGLRLRLADPRGRHQRTAVALRRPRRHPRALSPLRRRTPGRPAHRAHPWLAQHLPGTHRPRRTTGHAFPVRRADGDAFTVIVPYCPASPFSPQRPTLSGAEQTHELWHRLMHDHLGFRHYAAHGGDLAPASPHGSPKPTPRQWSASTCSLPRPRPPTTPPDSPPRRTPTSPPSPLGRHRKAATCTSRTPARSPSHPR